MQEQIFLNMKVATHHLQTHEKNMKIFLLTFLIIASIVVISGCAKKTEMPAQYKADNENFKQSVIMLNKARDLSNPPESENQSSFKLSRETEEKLFSYTEKGIRLGKLVSDEYLDFINPELKDMFKNKLIKGTEINYDGLMIMKSNAYSSEGIQKQIQGSQFVIEWINWFSKNGRSFEDKIFED